VLLVYGMRPETSHTSTGSSSPPQWLVVIAASAGGIQATSHVLAGLPVGFPGAVAVIQHRTPRPYGYLDRVLNRASQLPVVFAQDGQMIEPGVVYLAPSDQHLTVTGSRFAHIDGRRIRFVWSSANPLLESAAPRFRDRLIAVVLTGSGCDATDGVQAVKEHGGIVIAQDEATSQVWGMPGAAVRSGAVDYVLPLDAIAPALEALVHGRPVPDGVGAT
jgi:two-component system, chemotaxis family, protein-glutamate methylesterase/glutaminase